MNPIDCHFHIGRWKEEEGLSSSLSDLSYLIESGCLGGAAVMTTDRLENEALFEEIKDSELENVHFFYWAVPGSRKDIDFIKSNDEVKGVKVHPSLAKKPLIDKGYMGILEAAEEAGLPVYVHCGRWKEMSDYTFVLEAAGIHRNAPFIVGHFGGKHPSTWKALIDDIEKGGHDNVYIDISEMTEFMLAGRAVSRLGSERLLMGSDYPFSHPAMYIALVNALDISDEEKENILWRNITKLLKGEK